MSLWEGLKRLLGRGPFQPTRRQVERYDRVRRQLDELGVPRYPLPLYVEDDRRVRLRPTREVMLRAIVLHLVALRAEEPLEEAMELLRDALWEHVTPSEMQFLEDPDGDEAAARKMVWGHEAAWVLVWALGLVDRLDWPSDMCDMERLTPIVWKTLLGDETARDKLKLRFVAEVLDATQLTTQVHWAIRQAWIDKQMLPEKLDWTRGADLVAPSSCSAVGVVEQRHHALNWLIRFGDCPWDDVTTPT